MAQELLEYRLRIRDASTLANPDGTVDDLVVTSVAGGTNPYLKGEPSGDGQEVDPLTGDVRSGVYTIQLIDVITSGTDRLLTSKLYDSSGRQKMLSRRTYIEMRVNGGAWSTLIAGYLLKYRLVTALTWEIHVGDSRRVELNRTIFDGVSPTFPKRGCLFGGPIAGGWGPITHRGGWQFRVNSIVNVTVPGGTAHIVKYDFVRGFRGVNDPTTEKLQDALGVAKDAMSNPINDAVQSLYSPSVAPYALQGYPGVVARIAETLSGTPNREFTPSSFWGPGSNARLLIAQFIKPCFQLFWPLGLATPSVGDVHTITLFVQAVSEASPLYLTEHPVDLVALLLDDAHVPYDAASAAAVRAIIGDTQRVSMRITQSWNQLAFVQQALFGPFGFSLRTNDAGALEFFTTRVKDSAAPVATIGTNDLPNANDVIFDNDEASVISVVHLKARAYYAWDPNRDGTDQRPLDSVVDTPAQIPPVESADVATYGTREQVYDVPGMIHDVASFSSAPGAMLAAIAAEIFDRFGHGAPSGELQVLRGSDPGVKIGDEILLQPAHFPNLNKRYGDDPTVGPRVMQVLRRTETPSGPALRVLDAGSTQQPAAPAATISIAASAPAPRITAQFTITNAAAINAVPGLMVAVQWATGASSPAGGNDFIRYAPGEVETNAVLLPAVDPGTKVWVRARTEMDGRRASAWTAWVSVTLTAVTTPTLNSVLGLGFRTIFFDWTGANATDQTDFFVTLRPTPTAAGAFIVGRTYIITTVGTTNFIAIGASANLTGIIFVATGAGSGTGAAAEFPEDWEPYFAATAPPGATNISVDVPPPGGVGTDYLYAFGHRDPETGNRGTLLLGQSGTSNRKTTCAAPEVQVLNHGQDTQGSLASGVALGLRRMDVLDLRIQRAPDSGGAPGTWADLATVRASAETYIDYLPVGESYWYRATHSGVSNTDNFSIAHYATSQSIPIVLQPPATPFGVNLEAYYGVIGDGAATGDMARVQAALSDASGLNRFVDFGAKQIRIAHPGISAYGVGMIFDQVPHGDAGGPGFYPQGSAITAGDFVVGSAYTIVSVGTTNFVAIGAASNTPGLTFVATGAGSGTGTATFVAVTLSGPVSKIEIAIIGDGDAITPLYLNNPLLARSSNIRVHDFAGGVKIGRMWDCKFDTISVEKCGSATEHAYSEVDDGDTNNCSDIARLQVETPNVLAIDISPNNISVRHGVIHSEGLLNADPAKIAYRFGGADCEYGPMRIAPGANPGNHNIRFEMARGVVIAPRIEGGMLVDVDAYSSTNVTILSPAPGSTWSERSGQSGKIHIVGGGPLTWSGTKANTYFYSAYEDLRLGSNTYLKGKVTYPGMAITADSVSIANNGTVEIGANDQMCLLLICDDNGGSAIVGLQGGLNSVSAITAIAGAWSTVAGTAASANIYWNGGTNRYRLENKLGATRIFFLSRLGNVVTM